MIEFKRKNNITAVNVSIWKIIWNYMCWVLGGKPDKWQVKEKSETR